MFALLYLPSCQQCLTEVGTRRVPQDSIWIKQEDYIQERFGRSDRWLEFIFEAKEGNLLTTESIRDMFTVYTTMASLERQHEGSTITWTEGICWKSARNDGNDCRYVAHD